MDPNLDRDVDVDADTDTDTDGDAPSSELLVGERDMFVMDAEHKKASSEEDAERERDFEKDGAALQYWRKLKRWCTGKTKEEYSRVLNGHPKKT
jgi:hypothetical protein